MTSVRSPLTRPLPPPPAALRRGPLREGAFRSSLHGRELTVRIGRWLGIAFATCFFTGLISHYSPAGQAPSDGQSTSDGQSDPVGRRGFLISVGAAVATVTVVTVGQTLRPLAPLAVLAPRKPDMGPQGLPVNRTAIGANIRPVGPDFRLVVDGARPFSLSLAELQALPQYEAELPITCVEGWSANAHWRGVRLRDLLDRAGVPAGASARLTSLEKNGLYRQSIVDGLHAAEVSDALCPQT